MHNCHRRDAQGGRRRFLARARQRSAGRRCAQDAPPLVTTVLPRCRYAAMSRCGWGSSHYCARCGRFVPLIPQATEFLVARKAPAVPKMRPMRPGADSRSGQPPARRPSRARGWRTLLMTTSCVALIASACGSGSEGTSPDAASGGSPGSAGTAGGAGGMAPGTGGEGGAAGIGGVSGGAGTAGTGSLGGRGGAAGPPARSGTGGRAGMGGVGGVAGAAGTGGVSTVDGGSDARDAATVTDGGADTREAGPSSDGSGANDGGQPGTGVVAAGVRWVGRVDLSDAQQPALLLVGQRVRRALLGDLAVDADQQHAARSSSRRSSTARPGRRSRFPPGSRPPAWSPASAPGRTRSSSTARPRARRVTPSSSA